MLDDPSDRAHEHESNSLRDRVWRIVFLSDTTAGRAFDVVLLWLISISVVVVMLDSVPSLQAKYRSSFQALEWIFTILFTIEYAVRIIVVRNKWRYIGSFYGVIDLISIVPMYLTLVLTGYHYLLVIRVMRLLRIFRILKMARHMGEANLILNALRSSWTKIAVFLFFVCAVTMILGTLMYIVEGLIAENPGFNSVPQSVYWGIVTISTVGYGDITPVTILGKMISTVIILIGYGIIAVPTGIVTAELNMQMREIQMDTRRCNECGLEGHDPKAVYCKACGTML